MPWNVLYDNKKYYEIYSLSIYYTNLPDHASHTMNRFRKSTFRTQDSLRIHKVPSLLDSWHDLP